MSTVWRAKCSCGTDQRYPIWQAKPARCDGCLNALTWVRYEVTEERLWHITDGIDAGAISHFFETREAAEEALCKVVSADLRKDLSAPVLVTRRFIRRAR